MAFFKREHKKMAECSFSTLQKGYQASEIGLQRAVKSGNEKAMKKAMKQHQTFEYGLLYKQSPEYRERKYGKRI